MITKSQADLTYYRQTLYHVKQKNADGSPLRCRVNGMMIIKKGEWRLPVKFGLSKYFYIDESNAHEWRLEENG